MNRFSYKEHFKHKIDNCFVSDTFDYFLEACESLSLKDKRILMIAEKKFSGFYLKDLSEKLNGNCKSFDVFELTEETPDFHLTAARINAQAQSIGLTSSDCIISMGSKIADASARVFAAEYFPGITFIKIPITFIAQLLSTAEGDAELNFNFDKGPGIVLMADGNMAKDVRESVRETEPALVYMNITSYKFLDETERISGLGEAFRCAMGSDAGLFQYMEANSGKKADDFFEFLLNVVMNCLRVHLKLKENPKMEGYGYPVAIGLEKCTNFIIPHGQAVGIGMVVANNIAVNRGILKEKDTIRIARNMVMYGLTVMMNFTNDLIDALCASISDSDLENFVLINKLGQKQIVSDVTIDEIKTAMYYRR